MSQSTDTCIKWKLKTPRLSCVVIFTHAPTAGHSSGEVRIFGRKKTVSWHFPASVCFKEKSSDQHHHCVILYHTVSHATSCSEQQGACWGALCNNASFCNKSSKCNKTVTSTHYVINFAALCKLQNATYFYILVPFHSISGFLYSVHVIVYKDTRPIFTTYTTTTIYTTS